VSAQLYSSGNNAISSNKVGIGISNPQATFHIKDFSGAAIGGGMNYIPLIRFQAAGYQVTPATTYFWDVKMDLSSNLTFWQHSTQNTTPVVALKFGTNYVKVFKRFKVGDYAEFGTALTPDNTQGYALSLGLKELSSAAWQGQGAIMFTTSTGEFQLITQHTAGGILNGTTALSNNIRLSANADGVRAYGAFTMNTSNAFGYDMAINGDAIFNKVVVKSYGNWPDFVFMENYNLRSLEELKSFITLNGHLPDVPSAEEVKEEGVDVYEMNKVLLQKVEELTLYLIQLQEQVNDLKDEK
jgi:hypothetical protein